MIDDRNRYLAAAFCLLLAALSAVTSAFADVPPLDYDRLALRRGLIMGLDHSGQLHALPLAICVRDGQALRVIADVAVEVRPGQPYPPIEDQIPNNPSWRRLQLKAERFMFRLAGDRGYETWGPSQSRERGHFRRGYDHRDLILISIPSDLGLNGTLDIATPGHPMARYRLVNADRHGSARCVWANPRVYEGGFAP